MNREKAGNDYPLPTYNKEGYIIDLVIYLKDLRCRVFHSQEAVANHFFIHRCTISRYESENNLDRYNPPNIGYLAGLLRHNIEIVGRENRSGKQRFIEAV